MSFICWKRFNIDADAVIKYNDTEMFVLNIVTHYGRGYMM